MPLAILIGFEYTFNPLTSTIIDLFQAYNWCKSFGCDIHLITDVFHSLKTTPHVVNAVNSNICSSDIYDFYDNVPNKYIVTNNINLMSKILTIYQNNIPSDNRIVLYYSGHGLKDCLVMPDKSLLSCIDLRDNFLQSLTDDCELFWILDCCNPHGMHLPYSYVDGQYTLNDGRIDYIKQSIILITSAANNEKSIATNSGSIFSRNLFKLLQRKDLDLNTILSEMKRSITCVNTGYIQTVSIYSSYINNDKLWPWIGKTHSFPNIYDFK